MNADTSKHRLRNSIKWILLLAVFVVLLFAVGLYFAVLVAVLMVAIFLDLDSRPFYVAALTLLIISAVFAALSYDSATDWLASISFYALAAGIALQLSDYVREASGRRSPEGRSSKASRFADAIRRAGSRVREAIDTQKY
jgi:energy-coupling factor transporter transmembrane protein EcfT